MLIAALCTATRETSNGLTRGRWLYLCLLGEALALDNGVVQLCVRVGQLAVVHKQLKALCKARLRSVPALQNTTQLSIKVSRLCPRVPWQQEP